MFKTLDDYKKDKNNDKDKDKKKVTESYTGGEKSGLAVQNPEDSKNLDDLVSKAKQGSEANSKKGSKPKTNLLITLYKNGFTINDGPFRDYNDPNNKKFMEDLKNQRVPNELRTKYPDGLDVSLSDKREETYELPPPPKYIAFSGKGVSMGATNTEVPKHYVKNPKDIKPPKCDPSKDTTDIRIRLLNGTTVDITVNYTTKVHEIFNYVMDIAPADGNFQLVSGFPPKVLDDPSETVEEADLLDSTINQKLI